MSKSFCDDPEIRDLAQLGSGKTSSPGGGSDHSISVSYGLSLRPENLASFVGH